MTDLAAAVLTLRPTDDTTLPRWFEPLARLWFLEQVTQIDAALGAALQTGSRLRPYTFSSFFLPEEQRYLLRITTLQTELTRLLLDHLLPALPEQTITLGETTLHVEAATAADHPWAGTSSDSELTAQQSLAGHRSARQLELLFDTPTAFKGKTDQTMLPFPLPSLVFGSLVDRWNEFNTLKLPPEARQLAEVGLTVNHYRARTTRVHLHLAEQDLFLTGFTGFCNYGLVRDDPYWRGVLHTLGAYAFYSGVGVHTTMGLGRLKTAATNFRN